MSKNGAIVLALLAFQGMLAVVTVGGPESFGLNQIVVNWLTVLNVGVGIVLNQLKSLGGSNKEVEIVERVVEAPGKVPITSTTVTTTESGAKQ